MSTGKAAKKPESETRLFLPFFSRFLIFEPTRKSKAAKKKVEKKVAEEKFEEKAAFHSPVFRRFIRRHFLYTIDVREIENPNIG